MATRRPTAIINGVASALPAGDTLDASCLPAMATAVNGLTITVATATTVAVAASRAIIQSVSLSAISCTISTSNSGLLGLDTGTIAASTWYAVFIISNGSVASAMLSTSATAPTMPSGYSYSMRVGWVRTGTSGLIGTMQKGNTAGYLVGVNLTGIPTIASGTVSSMTEASIASFVPPTAKTIRLSIKSYGNTVSVASNANYSGSGVGTTNPMLAAIGIASTSYGNAHIPYTMLLESSYIYYTAGGSNNYIYCHGWEDNL